MHTWPLWTSALLTWWAGRRPRCTDLGPFWPQVWRRTRQCPCLWSVRGHLRWRWTFPPFRTARKLLPGARWTQMETDSSRTERQSVWQSGRAGVCFSSVCRPTRLLRFLQVRETPTRNQMLLFSISNVYWFTKNIEFIIMFKSENINAFIAFLT